MFENRRLLVATKHRKEKAIAPAFQKNFGITTELPSDFDTDQFGTFSGEIKRVKSPLDTAKEKAHAALAKSNCDLVIASEGSFGPHPSIPFIPSDEEFLYFYDKKNQFEISARTLSLETNYAAEKVEKLEELLAFAQKVDFPSHALILKVKNTEKIAKGIQTKSELIEKYKEFKDAGDIIQVETDMRALYNPSRMKVIEVTTDLLIEKLKSTCPECKHPGFWVTQKIAGLACGLCGSPTKGIKSEIWACSKCDYEQERTNPKGKMKEDPAYCDFCNP